MSQRPRLAGDGRLTLPSKVAIGHDGFIHGRFSKATVDPFDWTPERLLLAESFARLDLSDRRAMKAWWISHGTLDPFDFFGGDAEVPNDDWAVERPDGGFAEHRTEVADEQANVRWHLAMLVHLSEHRLDKAWDPAWGEFVLDGPDTRCMVGGQHAGVHLWSPYTFQLAREKPSLSPALGNLDDQLALLPEVTRRPAVTVRPSGFYGYLDDVWEVGPNVRRPAGAEDYQSLGSTWDSALSLERRLMEPYVAHAVERRFTIELQPRPDDGRRVFVAREAREWLSALAPIYLQLFESLRRISEGEPGAAMCRECGQPFLVLDARRRFFCNDRERFRFSQRERRRRIAADAAEAEAEASID
jgi:hypothetical protein